MIKLNGKALLIAAMICSLLGLAGCSSTPVNNATNNAVVTSNANNKPATANTPATTTTSPATTTTTGEKIGVAECDEYIEKLEACLTSAPEASRAQVKSSLDTMRQQWKQAAANPQTKAGLATGCKAALDTAKQSYSYCKW